MRKILILSFTAGLLAPPLAAATTYKCVVDGQTVYSQEKCAQDAEEVDAKERLSGVSKPTSAPATNAEQPAHSGKEPAAGTKAPAKATDQAANDCQSRLAAFRESQACFGRYRINANVMDPAAYKNCQNIPEPTDCLAGNAQ